MVIRKGGNMSLDVCVSPIKTTVGNIEDYYTEAQFREQQQIIENLISLIQSKIKEQTGKILVWNEEELKPHNEELVNEDDINVFCERVGDYKLIQLLRWYAAHIDIEGNAPLTPIGIEDVNKDKLLLQIYDGEIETKFKHLIDHSDCDGYYIPCHFDEPMWIHPSELNMTDYDEDLMISVGSSYKLMEELENLNKYLNIDTENLEPLEKYSDSIAGDKWEFVKWCWAVLYYMCQNSIQFRQPIIFC